MRVAQYFSGQPRNILNSAYSPVSALSSASISKIPNTRSTIASQRHLPDCGVHSQCCWSLRGAPRVCDTRRRSYCTRQGTFHPHMPSTVRGSRHTYRESCTPQHALSVIRDQRESTSTLVDTWRYCCLVCLICWVVSPAFRPTGKCRSRNRTTMAVQLFTSHIFSRVHTMCTSARKVMSHS